MSPSAPAASEHDVQFNLDGILSELGSYGKYQLLLLLLLAFRDSFLSMCNFNFVFTAPEVPFRCRIPECEMPVMSFNESWGSVSVGNSTCHRSVLDPSINVTAAMTCMPDMFLANTTVACEHAVYEDYNSIVAEFDLGCQPWKRTLIGTVHNLGLLFSFIISGLIADRYGRKVIIVGTPLVVAVAGLLKSVVYDYWILLVLEFIETAFGYGNASLVLALELVSQKSRVTFSCFSDTLAYVGGALFGLIAWQVPYWRHMMRAIYAPLLIVVFYIFLIDEGVRWLLVNNKKQEAVRVLNKVAKFNNITLSSKTKEMLLVISEEQTKMEESGKENVQETSHILADLRSKKILMRIVILTACFLCSMFVFNGTVIISTTISGNKYLNYSIMMLVVVPVRIVTALTLNRFGRKTPICVAYCLCAVFFMASAFVPKSIWWASVVFYMAGNMCSHYGNFCLQLVAMEVFPTTSRNTLTNIVHTIGRLGSVLAPQTPLLEQFMPGLPSVVFAVAALVPAVLALCLPDTSHVALPDKKADAERIDELSTDNKTTAAVA